MRDTDVFLYLQNTVKIAVKTKCFPLLGVIQTAAQKIKAKSIGGKTYMSKGISEPPVFCIHLCLLSLIGSQHYPQYILEIMDAPTRISG